MEDTKQLIKEKWDEIKHNIKDEFEITDIGFNIWIEPLKYGGINGDMVTIIVPNNQAQMVDYISKKYEPCFKSFISELIGRMCEINFVLEPEVSNYDENNDKNSFNDNSSTDVYKESNLNMKYRFESFVVGSNNNMAHSACLAVAESPGKDFNPLFIYGGPGLGKTHLMNSIGHYIVDHYKNMKVLYVTSEDFTNEVIESIRLGNSSAMTKLREKYRNIDVLLIDDIQFVIGKPSTQEEFFHTFNALHSAGKAIIISSDKHPKEMTTLDERFRSRFEWGPIVDIQPPVYETRVAILRKYSESIDKQIPNEVIDYIADNVKSNVRELEGAINTLNAFSKINKNRPIDLDLAKEALKDIIITDKPKIITPNIILDVVAEYFNVSKDDIISKKRSSEFTLPRHVFMYLCKEMTDTTLKAIGALLERDHTTVIHGVEKIKEEIENSSEMKDTINVIKNRINIS